MVRMLLGNIKGQQGVPGVKGDRGDKGDKGDSVVIHEFDQEYLIPTDFNTLQTALDDLSVETIKQGSKINLLIESGHKLNSFIELDGGDYSQFTISSQDPVVELSPSFPKKNFATFKGCVAPSINTIIDGKGLNVNGLKLEEVSRIRVFEGCGFINSGSTNLYATGGSYANVVGGVFTGGSQDSDDESGGTGGSGITCWGSTVFAERADVSNSKVYGVQGAHGGTVSFRNGIANDCIRHGIRATNASTVDARSATANNCGSYGVYALSSSVVNAYGSSCQNAGVAGVYASQSSNINAREVDVSGSDLGVYLDRSSIANFYNGTADNCLTHGIRVTTGSMLNAFGANVRNTGSGITNHGLVCDFGSTITMSGCRIENSTGKDVFINNGSTVNLKNSRTTSSTEQKPVLADTNMSSLNSLTGFGILWG